MSSAAASTNAAVPAATADHCSSMAASLHPWSTSSYASARSRHHLFSARCSAAFTLAATSLASAADAARAAAADALAASADALAASADALADTLYGQGSHVHPAESVTVLGSCVGVPLTEIDEGVVTRTAYISSVLSAVS